MPLEPPAARDPGGRQVLTARWPTSSAAPVAALFALAALSACGGTDGDDAVDRDSTSVVESSPLASSASEPSVPDSLPATSDSTASTPGVEPEGFSTITAVITSADGEVCEVCLWLADTADERGRGLMGVTDLGEAAGMAFRFDDPTQGAFYMFQTPTPLSIAWFGDDGAWVGADEMAPCLDTPAGDCPLYSPDARYVLAVEAFAGGLEPLGVGPGSRIELVADSEADECVLVGG